MKYLLLNDLWWCPKGNPAGHPEREETCGARGTVVDNLPAVSIPWLLKDGEILEVPDSTPNGLWSGHVPVKGETFATATTNTPAPTETPPNAPQAPQDESPAPAPEPEHPAPADEPAHAE